MLFRSSSRAGVAFDTSKRFGHSISRERGVMAGTTLELSRKALGASADSTTATVDVRAYAPGVGRQHVIAVRAAAGESTGAEGVARALTLGELRASPSVMDFGARALGLFRGTGGSTSTGTRLLAFNAEYRLPLARVERGRGTLPLLLRTVHASVFADVARPSGGLADGRWRRAAGGELHADAVGGFALPFVATVGAAWTDAPGRPRDVSAYARIGRAF